MHKEQELMEQSGGKPYYTYELAYPNGHVFYCGVGRGDRMYQHEQLVRRKLKNPSSYHRRRGMGIFSHKEKVILSIWNAGGEVLKNKVATHLTQEQAFDCEAERIQIYGMDVLTNEAYPRKRDKPRIPEFVML